MVEISTPDWAEDWDQSLIALTRSGDDYSQPDLVIFVITPVARLLVEYWQICIRFLAYSTYPHCV